MALAASCACQCRAQALINMGFEQNPLFGVSANDVTAVIDGTELQLGADIVITGGSGNYTYRWYTATEELGDGATLTVAEPGEYAVDISDECGCVQTVAFHIGDAAGMSGVPASGVKQTAVFDESGVLVKVFNGASYDSSSLRSGVYIVNKTGADGKVSVSKILIK